MEIADNHATITLPGSASFNIECTSGARTNIPASNNLERNAKKVKKFLVDNKVTSVTFDGERYATLEEFLKDLFDFRAG